MQRVALHSTPLRNDEETIAAENVRLYREHFITVRPPSDARSCSGRYPDALEPFSGNVSLAPGLNIVLVEVYVPTTAGQGDYRGHIRLREAGREQSLEYTLTVWNFILPERSSLKTAFGLDFDSIAEKEKVSLFSLEALPLLRRYYELLAEHRLSPISVFPEPVCTDPDSGRIDVSGCEEMWRYCYNSLRFNTLRIPFDESMPVKTKEYPLFSEGYNRRVIQYLSTLAAYLRKNGWLDRSYIYISTVDEPVSEADYAKSRSFYALVKQADPELRYRHGEQIDFKERNLASCDILDVNLLAYTRHQEKIRRLKNKEIGWYTAVGPKGDYPTYFIDRPSLEARILAVGNYYYQIPRLLYWSTTWWREVKNPYLEPMTYNPRVDLFANGDGSLIYPAAPLRLQAPVASLRLKMIRDGLEDYEYLMQLERRRGRKFTHAKVSAFFQSLTRFSRKSDEYYHFRRQIGGLLNEWK